MTTSDLKDYRANLIRSRDAEITAVNLKYKPKLEALAVLLEGELTGDTHLPQDVSIAGLNREISNIRQAVYESVKAATGNFSSATLLDFINKHFPNFNVKTPSFLSAVLWKMNRDGWIEVVEQGAGRTPSIYKKSQSFGAVNYPR